MKDVSFRKELYGKNAAALEAAHDPMIDLARMIEAPAREARKAHETQEEIKRQAYGEIANARFAIEGTSNYPDATFTLRLSYGKVAAYEEDGKQIPPFTDSPDFISARPNTTTGRPLISSPLDRAQSKFKSGNKV